MPAGSSASKLCSREVSAPPRCQFFFEPIKRKVGSTDGERSGTGARTQPRADSGRCSFGLWLWTGAAKRQSATESLLQPGHKLAVAQRHSRIGCLTDSFLVVRCRRARQGFAPSRFSGYLTPQRPVDKPCGVPFLHVGLSARPWVVLGLSSVPNSRELPELPPELRLASWIPILAAVATGVVGILRLFLMFRGKPLEVPEIEA